MNAKVLEEILKGALKTVVSGNGIRDRLRLLAVLENAHECLTSVAKLFGFDADVSALIDGALRETLSIS